jgi:NAD(P)-dependent dehydrogenase (short-subunit alcohol dehydrogenase family)
VALHPLSRKVALVTGAGRGIGRAIALGLANSGAAVALVARTREEIERVAEEIRNAGGSALAVPADVSQQAQVEAAVRATGLEFGPVDILVNNAGNNILGRFMQQDSDEWWSHLEVNLRGPYRLCRAVVPAMVERRWGRIVNIASASGKVGVMYSTAYCSAKHALIGFTRSLALEVAESGVTVNAVCPGFVETKLTEATFQQRADFAGTTREAVKKAIMDRNPMKAAMSSEDIVPSVLFLASEGSCRTTGEAINVSCGNVMH